MRRDHLALAAGHRGRGTPAFECAGPLGPGLAGDRRTQADPSRALKDLLAAGVRACVVAPEPELRRWFSWSWYWTDALVDDLVREGRLRKVDGYVMTAGQD
jgi:hypothetical protein